MLYYSWIYTWFQRIPDKNPSNGCPYSRCISDLSPVEVWAWKSPPAWWFNPAEAVTHPPLARSSDLSIWLPEFPEQELINAGSPAFERVGGATPHFSSPASLSSVPVWEDFWPSSTAFFLGCLSGGSGSLSPRELCQCGNSGAGSGIPCAWFSRTFPRPVLVKFLNILS